MFKIGCCGYTVGKSKYHEAFNLVELQQPFFQPPGPRMLSSWRSSAPAGFEFILKAWQLITHDPMSASYQKLKDPVPDHKWSLYGGFKPTNEVWRAWAITENEADVLGCRIIVFQCPSGFKPTEENLANVRKFFSDINRKDRIFVFEPRNWQEKDLRPLCEELDLVNCEDPFRHAAGYGKIRYLRLYGRGGFHYSYKEAELREVIEKYRDLPEVYVLFNNSDMFNNAYAMKEMVGGEGTAG